MCKKKIIIVGGGIGGLFTGAFLSKEGANVTIVEKNYTIGGGLQSYCRFGEIFDTGMHVIGGMHPGGNLYKICDYLGILDKINICPVNDSCADKVYVATDNVSYQIAKGQDGFINSLSSYFPHQKKELETYVKAMVSLTKELDLFYLNPSKQKPFNHSVDFLLPVDEFIAKYITDEKLRTVLSFQNILYAGEAGVTPAFIHAVISILYMNGSFRFVGGTLHFAEALSDIIEENGGLIIKGDAVTEINIENKKIARCKTASGSKLIGDYFISAIHPSSFVQLIDDKSVFSKVYLDRLEDIPNTYSALILNIKLKPNCIKYFNYTGHYFSDNYNVWESPSESSVWPNVCLYMTPPKQNQSEYASTMNVIVPLDWNEVLPWENTVSGNRGKEYLNWKKYKADIVIKSLKAVLPNIEESIEKIDISTPLTIRDFYGVKQGALYGFQKDCNNISYSKMPIKSKISNLFFTGQNQNLHGFCGVALTAIETSEIILESNIILQKINKFEQIEI